MAVKLRAAKLYKVEFGKEQFADTLQEVLNEADPDNDFIKLYWF